MTTGDIILHIFCRVDDSLPDIPRHSQAKLYPSKLVTIGILFALKGGHFRAFYRWLQRDYGDWFGDGTLPERTRLQRLLKTHQDWCELLMADPTFFTVIDSYPIELIFPVRQGRSPHQVGKKGRDKGRWSVGIKFCWLLNNFGRVVAWDWSTMNVNDKHFNPLVEPFQGQTIVLADYGFRDQDGVPDNMKICQKGTWNERMCVETALSLVTVICDLKRIRHRVVVYIQARLDFVSAMFNVLMDLFCSFHPDAGPYKIREYWRRLADKKPISCINPVLKRLNQTKKPHPRRHGLSTFHFPLSTYHFSTPSPSTSPSSTHRSPL